MCCSFPENRGSTIPHGVSRTKATVAAGLDVEALRAHVLAAPALEINALTGRAWTGLSHHGCSIDHTQSGSMDFAPVPRWAPRTVALMAPANAQTLTWSITDTPIGAVIGVASERGLCRVIIGPSRSAVTDELGATYPQVQLTRNDAAMKQTMQALAAITRGKAVTDLETDVAGTPFQTKVWNALRAIPKGKTRSYADVAKAIRRPTAARAVAGACASNPIALVVPCHRVIHSDGTVSGYAWGVDVKEALLNVEGAHWRG